MKKLLLFTTLITFVLGVSAQTTLFEDDFESYNLGEGIALQSDTWDTWSSDPGSNEDAVASDDYAESGSQSMIIQEPTTNSANDMILPLGNKTSGVYEVNFMMYFEAGKAGHFNIQHFEAPGNEWAFQTYFNVGGGGDGMLQANGEEIDFSYPEDTWFTVEVDIDIDDDETVLTIDGTDVYTFPFSVNWQGNEGTNQLGALNIFAGSHDDATGDPLFYIENVEYIEVESGADPPQVGVSTTEITTDGSEAEFFTIENTGEQNLNYEVYPVYPNVGSKKSASVEGKTKRVRLTNHPKGHQQGQVAQAENGVEFNPNRDGTLTHVMSDLTSGVGYPDETDVKAGALFRPQDVEDFIGMQIDMVILYHAYAPMNNESTMKIWDRGEFITPGPGELVYEKEYTANDDEQVEVTVDDEMYITGKDLWVGYELTDPGEGVYPLGMDEGPQISGVNFTSTGPGWSEFTGTDYGNLGIIVELVGDGTPNWMSLTPADGTIEPGNSEEIMVDFETTGLESGVHEAEIHVGSNDPENQYNAIDVTLNISGTSIGDQEKVGVMTFPNPVNDYFNVKANERIDRVQVLNAVGQVVYSAKVNDDAHHISTADFDKGVYMVRVETTSGEVLTNKIVVE